MVLLALYMTFVTALGEKFESGRVSFSACLEKCMEICMRIRYARESECDKGCQMGCKQLQGKGSIFYRPMG